MSVVLVSIIAIIILLVAAKAYFQEKKKDALNEAVPPASIEMDHQKIVHDRLQEIAKFESELEVDKEEVKASTLPSATEEKKPKAKQKKYYKPKKQQPKIKAK